MSLVPIDLNTDLISAAPPTSNGFNLPNIDMQMLNDIGDTIKLRGGKEAEIIQTMQDFATDAKHGLHLFNEAANEVKNAMHSDHPSISDQWKDPKHKSPLKDSVNNIRKDIKTAKSSIKKAKNAAKSFMNSINPKNGLNALKALAQFLLCPEESFLKDIANAFDSVVNGIKNIKPKMLLEQAMMELANHITGRFPAVNNLLNFILYMRRYFNTGMANGLNTTTDVFNHIVSKLTNKWGLSDDYDGLALLNDIVDPFSNIFDRKGMYTPLPVDRLANKCSVLGRIIAQLESSYRNNNRFDDIITTDSVLEYIRDPEMYSIMDGLLGINKMAEAYEMSAETAAVVGHHNKSAFNAVLTAFMVSNAQIELIESKLDEANKDPSLYEINREYAVRELEKITLINSIALQRLMAFEEGIKNIEREAKFFDVSEILGLRPNSAVVADRLKKAA